MPYLTPNGIPEDDDCRPLSIPASSEWLALFGGALTELTKSYNWQQFGALTVEETVAKMQSIIDNWYTVPCAACTTPGGYRVLRINNSGQLEQLDESGNWQPATDEYQIPLPAAREGGSSSDQICLAASNAVNVLEQLYENLSDSLNGELDEAEAISAFILALIALVGFEFAPITWAIAAFMTVVFSVLYSALEYIIADLWDESVSDQIICFLVQCASNESGVVTFDWTCFNQKLESLANGFSLTAEQLRLYVQIGYMLYFIGGVDGLNLAGGTTEITSADCDNCGGWCYIAYFTETDGGFVADDCGGVTGEWIALSGWNASDVVNCGGVDRTLLQISLTFESSIVIDTIDIHYDYFKATSSGDTEGVGIYANAYANSLYSVTQAAADEGLDLPVNLSSGFPAEFTGIDVYIQPAFNAQGGTGRMVAMQLTGSQEKPTFLEAQGWVECP